MKQRMQREKSMKSKVGPSKKKIKKTEKPLVKWAYKK